MNTSDIEVKYVDHMGSDLSIVNAARVSFKKKSKWESEDGFRKLSEKDEKLIKYLAKHRHTSPFNHTFLTMYVKAPVFVARQLVKHKFMPWNEVSRRYVDEEPEFYMPDYWRKKADNVKQGSSDDVVLLGYDSDIPSMIIQSSADLYEQLLQKGVCPEQARMVLPQNMMTEWYWSGTLGAFADMLRLRLSPYTQKETREVAEKIKNYVINLFPVALPALLNDPFDPAVLPVLLDNPFEGKVAISEELLEDYKNDSYILKSLMSHGVDKWPGYREAVMGKLYD